MEIGIDLVLKNGLAKCTSRNLNFTHIDHHHCLQPVASLGPSRLNNHFVGTVFSEDRCPAVLSLSPGHPDRRWSTRKDSLTICKKPGIVLVPISVEQQTSPKRYTCLIPYHTGIQITPSYRHAEGLIDPQSLLAPQG